MTDQSGMLYPRKGTVSQMVTRFETENPSVKNGPDDKKWNAINHLPPKPLTGDTRTAKLPPIPQHLTAMKSNNQQHQETRAEPVPRKLPPVPKSLPPSTIRKHDEQPSQKLVVHRQVPSSHESKLNRSVRSFVDRISSDLDRLLPNVTIVYGGSMDPDTIVTTTNTPNYHSDIKYEHALSRPADDAMSNEDIIDNKVDDMLGREAWKLTNQFREQNQLSSLVWSSEIAQLCVEHSRNMGERRVSFGHDGFSQRVSRYPRTLSSVMAAENVFYCTGASFGTSASVSAVEGWKRSPGHRKNMLTRGARFCGVGSYRNRQGEIYFTQMFA